MAGGGRAAERGRGRLAGGARGRGRAAGRGQGRNFRAHSRAPACSSTAKHGGTQQRRAAGAPSWNSRRSSSTVVTSVGLPGVMPAMMPLCGSSPAGRRGTRQLRVVYTRKTGGVSILRICWGHSRVGDARDDAAARLLACTRQPGGLRSEVWGGGERVGLAAPTPAATALRGATRNPRFKHAIWHPPRSTPRALSRSGTSKAPRSPPTAPLPLRPPAPQRPCPPPPPLTVHVQHLKGGPKVAEHLRKHAAHVGLRRARGGGAVRVDGIAEHLGKHAAHVGLRWRQGGAGARRGGGRACLACVDERRWPGPGTAAAPGRHALVSALRHPGPPAASTAAVHLGARDAVGAAELARAQPNARAGHTPPATRLDERDAVGVAEVVDAHALRQRRVGGHHHLRVERHRGSGVEGGGWDGAGDRRPAAAPGGACCCCASHTLLSIPANRPRAQHPPGTATGRRRRGRRRTPTRARSC